MKNFLKCQYPPEYESVQGILLHSQFTCRECIYLLRQIAISAEVGFMDLHCDNDIAIEAAKRHLVFSIFKFRSSSQTPVIQKKEPRL